MKNLLSTLQRKSGRVDQSASKYLGVTAGNRKMTDITILQLGDHTTAMSGMTLKIHSENRANESHKVRNKL